MAHVRKGRDLPVTCKEPPAGEPMLQRSTGRQIRKRSPTLGEPYRHPDLKGRIGKGQLTHLVGTNRYRTKVTMTVTGSQSQADKSPGKEIRRSREMAPRANPKAMVPKRKEDILNQVQRVTEEERHKPEQGKARGAWAHQQPSGKQDEPQEKMVYGPRGRNQ